MSETEDLGAAYVEVLTRFYGRAEHPDFSRIGDVHARMPYSAVVAELEGHADAVQDVTDINHNVSLQLACRVGGGTLVVFLSYIGPYALILTEQGAPVAPDTRAAESITKTLRKSGFCLPAPEDLERAVSLWREASGVESLYNALFVVDEDPPWTASGTSSTSTSPTPR